MKKTILLFIVFILLVSLFTGCSLSEKYVVLYITDTEGNPLNGIFVCEEKYANGTESFTNSEILLSNTNGELKYFPDELGNQNLAIAYFYSGKEMKWDIVTVEITKEDTSQHTKIHITYSPEA